MLPQLQCAIGKSPIARRGFTPIAPAVMRNTLDRVVPCHEGEGFDSGPSQNREVVARAASILKVQGPQPFVGSPTVIKPGLSFLEPSQLCLGKAWKWGARRPHRNVFYRPSAGQGQNKHGKNGKSGDGSHGTFQDGNRYIYSR